MVGTTLRSSLLDHVYTSDADCVQKVESITPCFGDHMFIVAHLFSGRPDPEIIISRDWRNYSKDKLVEMLSRVEWSGSAGDVQQVWNDFENKLISVIDKLVPLTEFVNGKICCKLCPTIKPKYLICFSCID